MTPSPCVSVIIPTFNRSHFLHQAVNSVLAQTYSDFEIVVVDDGSNDDTAEVLGGFKDDRIVYIHQNNSGRSSARNLGLIQARGKYIAFLDDDDFYLPARIESQLSFLEDRPNLDAVVSGTHVVDENGMILVTLTPWLKQPELKLHNCLYACPVPTCSVLLRRRVLDFVTCWFDPQMELAEDTDFFVRLMYAGAQFAWLHEVVSVRRLHPSTSQRDGAGYGRSYIRLLDKIFARPDLPEKIVSERQKLYTHFYFVGACHAYSAKQINAAKQSMSQALGLYTDTSLDQTVSDAVGYIVSFANSFLVSDSVDYINFVFDNLPELPISLHRYRRRALGAFYMKRVFGAREKNISPTLRDWVLGIFYDPRWVRNRGVLLTPVKRIFGMRRIGQTLEDGPHPNIISQTEKLFTSGQ